MKFNQTILASIIMALLVTIVQSATPTRGMVMADIDGLKLLTSKEAPADTRWTFEELIAAGLNGIHFRAWTFGANYYSQAEMVHEAHEYGLWVAGGGFASLTDRAIEHVAQLGVDFAQIDEPFAWADCKNPHYTDQPFNQSVYNQLKAMAKAASPRGECPVIISDVSCFSEIWGWTGVDGAFNEVYIDSWHPYIAQTKQYINEHPGTFSGMWVWSIAGSGGDGEDLYANYGGYAGAVNPLGAGDFELWFNDSWSQTKNIILFIFNKKAKGVTKNWGTNWSYISNHMKTTTGLGETIPVWKNFSPGSSINKSAPDCKVQVQGTFVGLDPTWVECYYAVDPKITPNTKWIKHDDVSASGTKGTKEWVTITANRVPFNNVSSSNNKIMFKIKDTYPYKYHRSTRIWKKEFTVKIAALDWSNFKNDGVVTSLPANLTVNVKDVTGLDLASVVCEYTTDGGTTWKTHPAEASQGMNEQGQHIVTIDSIPFTDDKAKLNKIRFSVIAGADTLKSSDFPVKVELPPVAEHLTVARTGDNLDVTVKAHDENGLVVGSQPASLREETLLLMHLDGDLTNSAGNEFVGTALGGPTYVDATWSPNAGKALKFDGVNDYVNLGFNQLGRSKLFTLSAWVKAENTQPALSFGGNEVYQSLFIRFNSGNIGINAWDMSRKGYNLSTAAGSFSHNEWHHFVFTWDGKYANVYVDGKLQMSKDWTGFNLWRSQPLCLGKVNNRQWFFKGQLDDVQFISRALGDNEVAAEYNSGAFRYSGDGGISWSDWEMGTIEDSSGGVTTFGLSGASMSQKPDSFNIIQFVAQDMNGDAGLREFFLLENDVVSVGKTISERVNVSLYPNPFRDKIQFNFNLQTAKSVKLDIYGIDGKMVRSYHSGLLRRGAHSLEWDGRGNKGQELNAGQYFARVTIGDQMKVEKIMMLK
ncbi:MAG: T9SS type A sorting domain-containing protein [Fibrobacteria bacterium]|nr:T9SS type A sorting domain-containing protein [Fibrobacteria bacterium]